VRVVVDYRAHCSKLQHTAAHCSTLQHTAAHCSTLQHNATHCISGGMQSVTGWRKSLGFDGLHIFYGKWLDLQGEFARNYLQFARISMLLRHLVVQKWASSVSISGLTRERESVREREPTRQSVFVSVKQSRGNEYVSIHHIYICAHVSCMSKHTHKHTRQSHKRPTPHTKQLSAYQHVTRIRHNSGILDSMHDADVASLSTSKSRCVEREKEN